MSAIRSGGMEVYPLSGGRCPCTSTTRWVEVVDRANPARRAGLFDREVGDDLTVGKVDVRRHRQTGPAGIDRQEPGSVGLGHRHVGDDVRRTLVIDDARFDTRRHLASRARPGVEHARRSRKRIVRAGREPPLEIGDEMGWRTRDDADPSALTWLGDHQVGHGLVGDEVHVRRIRRVLPARIGRSKAISGGLGDVTFSAPPRRQRSSAE